IDNEIESSTEYFYENPNTLMPTREVKELSNGIKYITRSKFFSDYNLPTSNTLQIDALGIHEWHYPNGDDYPDLPVETYTTLKKPSAEELLIKSSISVFEVIPSNYRKPVLKYQMTSVLNSPIPLSEYNVSHI